MFGKKKEIITETPQDRKIKELNHKLWESRKSIEEKVKKIYILNNTIGLYLGADKKYEEQTLEDTKQCLRNQMANYEMLVKEYRKELNSTEERNITPKYELLTPLDSHVLVEKIMENILKENKKFL